MRWHVFSLLCLFQLQASAAPFLAARDEDCDADVRVTSTIYLDDNNETPLTLSTFISSATFLTQDSTTLITVPGSTLAPATVLDTVTTTTTSCPDSTVPTTTSTSTPSLAQTSTSTSTSTPIGGQFFTVSTAPSPSSSTSSEIWYITHPDTSPGPWFTSSTSSAPFPSSSSSSEIWYITHPDTSPGPWFTSSTSSVPSISSSSSSEIWISTHPDTSPGPWFTSSTSSVPFSSSSSSSEPLYYTHPDTSPGPYFTSSTPSTSSSTSKIQWYTPSTLSTSKSTPSPSSSTSTTVWYTPSTSSTSRSTSSPSSSSTSASSSSSTSTSSSSSTTSTSQTSIAQPTSTSGSNSSISGYSNSLYFTNWGIYGANFQPQQIPADKVTRILYSFADIGSDGTVKSSDTYADVEKHYSTDSWSDSGNNAYGCVKQLYLLKQKHRHLKMLLSIGGWTYSSKFAPVAATAAGRTKFATTAVTLMGDYGFDGIDIDWEYPASATEAQDFVLLLQEVRDTLDDYAAAHAPGYHFLITVASPAGPTNYEKLDFPAMDALVDAWNLMAYDYAGSWDTTSGHQANVFVNTENELATKFSTDRAVKDYLAGGVTAEKLQLGLPLYGRAFESTTGLGKAYSGVGSGTVENGIWSYFDLPRSGATELYDDIAKASYSYDSSTQELVSYDTVDSVKYKVTYLNERGLGGAMFWEASGDRTGDESLVGTVASALGSLDTSNNLLSYPASQYDNIKSGMQ